MSTAQIVITPAFIARFWSRVAKPADRPGEPTACWEWQGGRATQMRYGIVAVGHTPDGKKVVDYAHRIAWVLRHGAVPEGQCVLHRCDNPICCRDEHHFLGDRTTNSDDKVAKGRQSKGAEVGTARLTESQAAEILTAFATGEFSMMALARKYGVVRGTIAALVTGRTWCHVDAPRTAEAAARVEARRGAEVRAAA